MRPDPFRVISLIDAVTWSLVLLASPAGGGCVLLAAAPTLTVPPRVVGMLFVVASLEFRLGTQLQYLQTSIASQVEYLQGLR